MQTVRDFLRDDTGFQGAEKSLLITLSLAVVFAIGGLIKEGSSAAGGADLSLSLSPSGPRPRLAVR